MLEEVLEAHGHRTIDSTQLLAAAMQRGAQITHNV